jgi:glucokinase
MILAGDIGGTKVNLAVFEIANGQLTPGPCETFRSGEHPGLEDIVGKFLSQHHLKVDHACFGVAGPIRHGRAQLTNLPWVIDEVELTRALRLKSVCLLNDLQANAYGIAELQPHDFAELNRGSNEGGNMAIISAGTGLGEAGLFRDGEHYIATASEGGHADFSPRTDIDIDLLRYLRERFGQVSWEHVLSGPGFCHIYQFLRDTGRGEEPHWLKEQFLETDPSIAITRAGLERKCDLCVQTLELFAIHYGAEAGNLALKMLATGGVYVGGGIAPKIIDHLKNGSFMEAFIGKGRMKNLLGSIPVKIILNEKTALLGAARYVSRKIA